MDTRQTDPANGRGITNDSNSGRYKVRRGELVTKTGIPPGRDHGRRVVRIRGRNQAETDLLTCMDRAGRDIGFGGKDDYVGMHA